MPVPNTLILLVAFLFNSTSFPVKWIMFANVKLVPFCPVALAGKVIDPPISNFAFCAPIISALNLAGLARLLVLMLKIISEISSAGPLGEASPPDIN